MGRTGGFFRPEFGVGMLKKIDPRLFVNFVMFQNFKKQIVCITFTMQKKCNVCGGDKIISFISVKVYQTVPFHVKIIFFWIAG